jgi:HK97 family phage major capsid protein
MIKELRDKLAKAIERMDALLNTADAEKRNLNEDEEKEYTELDASLPVIKADIAKREKLEDEKAAMSQTRRSIPILAATHRAEDPKEFKTLGEFLHSVRFAPADPRLESLEQREQRGSSMGVGAEGGFAVPTQFRETLLSVTPGQAIFRPRATIIPAGSPPDAEVSMPALNQGSAQNMYGGVAVQWIGEGDTKPETDMRLKEVKLKPHEVAGHIIVTDKLLRNWGAAEAVLSAQLRLAVTGAEETAFYSGNGVARPLGVTQSPARINYARSAANTIVFADIVGMYARLRQGGSPVWIASPTCIPQLATIADAGSNNLWVSAYRNASEGMPPSLMGIPVLFHDRSVALGTAGDLILADLGYYLIKDGSGPFVMASEHVYFTSNRTVIKVFWNVDGTPWLNEPIPLEGSAANTVSPFVVLN